jgi:hypothetical protein
MFFLTLTFLSITSLTILSTILKLNEDQCSSTSLLHASIIVLVSVLYYVIVKACSVLLITLISIRNRRDGYRTSSDNKGSGITRVSHDSIPSNKSVIDQSTMSRISEDDETELENGPGSPVDSISSLSEFDFELSEVLLENAVPDKSTTVGGKARDPGETYTVGKAWSNIYGLGIAVFCLIYSLQMDSAYGNIMMCISFIVVTMEEYKITYKRRASVIHGGSGLGWCIYYRRLIIQDTFTFFWTPLFLTLLGVSMCSHIAAAVSLGATYTDENTNWIALVFNCIAPMVAPIALKHMKRPENMADTIELSIPVAAMIALCTMSVLFATSSTCIYNTFHDQDGTPMFNPVHFLAFAVSPIVAMFTIAAVLAANDAKRSLDVAVIVLCLSSIRLYKFVNPQSDTSNVLIFDASCTLIHFTAAVLYVVRSGCCKQAKVLSRP